jgi:hypothetical protein
MSRNERITAQFGYRSAEPAQTFSSLPDQLPGENMSGMAMCRANSASELRFLQFVLLVSGLMSLLLALDLKHWALGVCFLVLIPAGSIKAFMDYRRKHNVIANNSILNSTSHSN